MAFFKWKDSFSIGVDEIDQQHRLLLKYLNDCHIHVSAGKRSKIDPGLIDGLKAYAVTHFRFEESLMRTKGYPKLGQQEQQHKYFESQIVEFETAYAGGTERTAESVLAFLIDWFLKHILEQDKEFVAYVM